MSDIRLTTLVITSSCKAQWEWGLVGRACQGDTDTHTQTHARDYDWETKTGFVCLWVEYFGSRGDERHAADCVVSIHWARIKKGIEIGKDRKIKDEPVQSFY